MVILQLASVDIGSSLLSSEVARLGHHWLLGDACIVMTITSPTFDNIRIFLEFFQVDTPNFHRYVVRSNVKGRLSVGQPNQLMSTDPDVQYCGISESSDLQRGSSAVFKATHWERAITLSVALINFFL